MKSILPILGVAILFGCVQEKSSQEKPVEETENTPVEIIKSEQIVKKEEKADCTEEPCTKVSISYPRFENLPNINQIAEERIQKTLSEDYVMEASGSESTDELIDMFMASYKDFITNFPESSTAWSLEVNITESYATADFISLEVATYSYTGGAHPNGFVDYINLKKDSKKPLTLTDLISDTARLKEIAQKAFRAHYEIKAEDSFSDYGFTFDNDQFTLPETIGFDEDGMVLYYNSYEIAPYAAGPTMLSIPLEELNGLLKI